MDHAAILQVLMSLNTFLPGFQNAEKLRDLIKFLDVYFFASDICSTLFFNNEKVETK